MCINIKGKALKGYRSTLDGFYPSPSIYIYAGNIFNTKGTEVM